MKLGLFFGAGAEISYGLPSGGTFAIDLFRQDPTIYKERLRKELNNVNITSPYAANWLPDGYKTKPIYAFGKNEFSSIIESSIQYKRHKIIEHLNNFDNLCEKVIKNLEIDEDKVSDLFSDKTGMELGEILYTHKIQLNPILSNSVTLFNSKYYSAILEIIKLGKNVDDLRRYAIAFLQLLVGSHGHDLVKKLNEELFTNTPDDLPIFDDIFGMFRLEFNQVGSEALELLLGQKKIFSVNEDGDLICLLSAICQKALEYIFVDVLDYQKLLDEHFRYLFSPKTEWAKFTKMVVFLETARDYIKNKVPNDLKNKNGYYNDLNQLNFDEISLLGTSNYNSIIVEIQPALSSKIIHLNGSVTDFYNPYKNSIVQFNEKPENLEQIHIPFILTQSGLKPLTSVEMSRRYVSLFDAFVNSDAVIVVGFGFNKDDSHINGLFRELVEIHNKKLFVVGVSKEKEIKEATIFNLRIDKNRENIIAISVDRDTRQKDGKLWLEYIKEQIIS
ncbi:Uncharacterised protein [Actinobacillus porcinus]|uniref:SIR2-like domain-containing protein n=1 Tax=Actinobacillus porcinus TaxID=51048 RepID=A0ABY6TMA3_9PAST|nr:hypothetical protein [Actinobacillus porcinus]VFY94068.1 Uncharacterised protein [Actinobacillus porcinus]VTU09687.1 Uncharacterised protein [Actinobacillus porcinus]